MQEKIRNLMIGRNGFDKFSQFLVIFGCVGELIFSFLNPRYSLLFLVITFYGFFRVFSRNVYKRRAENTAYLQVVGRLKNSFKNIGFTHLHEGRSPKAAVDRDHKIFKCPSCKQKIRVPKGRGKIEITCPRCKGTFIKRT